MADHSPEDWLPAGWTVSVRVRRSGKKDKHYFAPSGLKFSSKVEVTRYLKTVQCSPPQPKEEKAIIFKDSAKDASAEVLQRSCPKSDDKRNLGHRPSFDNGSPESEEKYYSAEETAEDDCGDTVRNASLKFEDKGNTDPEQPPGNVCEILPAIYSVTLKTIMRKPSYTPNFVQCDSPKPREDRALAVKEENIYGSKKATILNQSTENPKGVESIHAEEHAEEHADRICSSAAENGSQSKEEENVILEEKRTDASDHVKQGNSPCSKEKNKTRPKQSAYVVIERGVAEGLPDGWIKEIKARKKNNVVRKDPYYIDPASGYVFRSMKDALRYVATGIIGRLAFKRKDESDTELEDDKSSSPVESKRQKSDKNGTSPEDQRKKQFKEKNLIKNETSTGVQSSKETIKQVVKPADIGEAAPVTEISFDHGVSVTDLSQSDLLKPRGSLQNGNGNNTDETDCILADGAEVHRNEQPLHRRGDMPALLDKAVVLGDDLPSEMTRAVSAQAEAAGILQDVQSQEKTEKSPASADEPGVSQSEQLLEKAEGFDALADEAGLLRDEQSLEKAEEVPEGKTTPKSRKKKFLDLPRRTSSRLAGVEVDLSMEVTRAGGQRGAVRKLEEGNASGGKRVTARDCSQTQPQPIDASTEVTGARRLRSTVTNLNEEEASGVKSVNTRDCSQMQPQPIEVSAEVTGARAKRGAVRKLDDGGGSGLRCATTRDRSQIQPPPKRARRGNKFSGPTTSMDPPEASPGVNEMKRDLADDEEKGRDGLSLPQQNTSIDNQNEKPNADDELEEKPILPFELPSGDILSDPCIEFAIKTLTGIDFDTPRSTPKSSSDSHSSRNAASLKVQAEPMEIERGVDKKQTLPDKSNSKACNFEEKAGAVVPSSSMSNLPFVDSWQDPCIEFAIKTLTGGIPVEYDLDIPDLMRQQMRSSQIQESSDVALADAGLDNFCRTDLLWQHSTDGSSVKTGYKQQSGVGPIGQQAGSNVDLQRAGGAVLRQHHQDRGNKYQR